MLPFAKISRFSSARCCSRLLHLSLTHVKGCCLQLLNEIRGLELYRLVDDALMAGSTCDACLLNPKQADLLAERLTIFVLLAPKEVWDNIQDANARVRCLELGYPAAEAVLIGHCLSCRALYSIPCIIVQHAFCATR